LKPTDAASKEREPLTVYRITVDELLSEDLVRLLVAQLSEAPNGLIDDEAIWGEEREVLATSATLEAELKMTNGDEAAAIRAIEGNLPKPDRDAKTDESALGALWQKLTEGLVLLIGGFFMDSPEGSPPSLRLKKGIRSFVRVDILIHERERSEILYSNALRGVARSGKAHGRKGSADA
jgi:hypothetical protein